MNRAQKQGCIVITGSSKGIGFGLAKAFLSLGESVVISGRHLEQLNHAVKELSQLYDPNQICAVQCNITDPEDIQKLWEKAVERFQSVEIWINNAATCPAANDFANTSTLEIQTAIQTNILGTMLASQIAYQGMLKQGQGQIFNMEGWGSRGEWSAGTTVYATTKRAVAYLTHALYKESKNRHILIGSLSPGMVATDLLISSWQQGQVQHWNKMKRLFYFIIDPPDAVCPYLAQRILKNRKNNVRIVWMTPWRLLRRFFQPYYWRRNPVKDTALEHFGSK